jgi:hypothetical protein
VKGRTESSNIWDLRAGAQPLTYCIQFFLEILVLLTIHVRHTVWHFPLTLWCERTIWAKGKSMSRVSSIALLLLCAFTVRKVKLLDDHSFEVRVSAMRRLMPTDCTLCRVNATITDPIAISTITASTCLSTSDTLMYYNFLLELLTKKESFYIWLIFFVFMFLDFNALTFNWYLTFPFVLKIMKCFNYQNFNKYVRNNSSNKEDSSNT